MGDLWFRGRFPAGYPVGQTVGTKTSADAAYLTAGVKPLAKLDVESHVPVLTIRARIRPAQYYGSKISLRFSVPIDDDRRGADTSSL